MAILNSLLEFLSYNISLLLGGYMKLSDVVFSLSLGGLISKRQLKFIIAIIFISMLFPLITIGMVCTPFVWDTQRIICVIFANIISLSLLFFLIYVLVRDKINKKKVVIWLNDAIELKAYSKTTDRKKLPFLPRGITIEVVFKINNISYVREISKRNFGGGKAYYSIMKYADREIDILYSPKYDEVIILKDKQ